MKILVTDDERLARLRLRGLIEGLDGYVVCAEAATGAQALEAVSHYQPDILLLDIRMPGMDGLEVARHLQSLEQPPAIIFTTAYNDYALQAFDAHAVDYLLKPVRRERLQEALAHARRLTRAQQSGLASAVPGPVARERICVNVRGNLQLVPVSEVRCFIADSKYVTIRTDRESLLCEETLKALEQEFAGSFVRVHRNALVSVQYLAGLERDAAGHVLLRLNGLPESLEVSRRLVPGLRKLLKDL